MTDIEISNKAKLLPITMVAKKAGFKSSEVIAYGQTKAKITEKPKAQKGKLILVTALNPTKFGEGKTTVSIGLADGLRQIKKNACLALREPSLGPVFGIKGGATGGGYAQMVPMEDINLHFTGDFHAITSANNLLSSIIDNHIFQGNELNIDKDKIFFSRCLDCNDRALREITVAQSKSKTDVSRKEKFTITAASEIMAILSLSKDFDDLKSRLGDILVAQNMKGEPVYARDLKAENAMAILLKDAIYPNLVQTLENTPCLVHCGPFANIAHGCSSVIASSLALGKFDYVVTEAGFGADLGAEKFLDIKCRTSGLKPNAVVLVATIRAIKLHGGQQEDRLKFEDYDAMNLGLPLLKKHIENLTQVYKLPVVVAINRFETDKDKEINVIKTFCKDLSVTAVECNCFAKGGKGAIELANEVVKVTNNKAQKIINYPYELDESIKSKITKLATKIYGAKKVEFSELATKNMKFCTKYEYDKFPIVIAKTQYSLSDNAKLLGVPEDFTLNITNILPKTGAKFLVCIAGNMNLMPGLSSHPASEKMTIDENKKISGLF